jgi:aryl-alcohol dehydrogenase-like predicted oxidoreductase
MNKRTLGRTGIRVSELCLGTLNFGWGTNREESFAILDRYRGEGGDFVQMSGVSLDATLAPDWTSFSEAYVGEWMRDRAVPRGSVFLSSVLSLTHSGEDGAVRSQAIARACESSLARLGTDHLDLLLCRWHPSFASADEVIGELTGLVRSGRIRYFGLTGFPLWRAVGTLGLAQRASVGRMEAFQAPYSLLENGPNEAQLLEFCAEHRVALLAQSPLAGGFLAARYDPEAAALDERTRRLRAAYGNRRGLAVYSEVESIADARGVAPATVALAWVLAQPVVTAAVIGAKSVWHLRDALRAGGITLTGEECTRLAGAAGAPATAGHPGRRPDRRGRPPLAGATPTASGVRSRTRPALGHR